MGTLNPVSSDLEVYLFSSDISELIVPFSVTIPAGQASANFDLTVIDDSILDGTQTVTITFSVPGCPYTSGPVRVHDNEAIPFRARRGGLGIGEPEDVA